MFYNSTIVNTREVINQHFFNSNQIDYQVLESIWFKPNPSIKLMSNRSNCKLSDCSVHKFKNTKYYVFLSPTMWKIYLLYSREMKYCRLWLHFACRTYISRKLQRQINIEEKNHKCEIKKYWILDSLILWGKPYLSKPNSLHILICYKISIFKYLHHNTN